MKVRTDFDEVSGLIGRLISIGEEFRAKDSWWSHLKNNEDWGALVWPIRDLAVQRKIERVYADGRDMELFLSSELEAINFDITKYPTLTAVVERFNGTWIDQIDRLEQTILEAIEAKEQNGQSCWAFDQMVITFREQIALAKVVRQTLLLLKNTNLFKLENGIPVEKETKTVSISNVSNSNISIQSTNVNQQLNVDWTLFDDIINAIKSSEIDNKEPLVTVVEEMREGAKGGTILPAYQKFMGLAADHLTVLAPFLPALASLL
ncbi:hypothetical protein O1D89_003471 [Vibrio cholerae]|uniref:hypothetical protein n=1 Tax=Vibrio cholerae TaxID=666 RepID=UPI000BA8E875|nr:hypothetical protein [Vibrio cholerae]EKF9165039.1 hypothetical protein [Vibrio cholerae]EKF9982531.1 hypothetical protein [Vibrio cholerae]PAR81043.1 hypothetical protein CGT85_17195 [Vibrio cholerae]